MKKMASILGAENSGGVLHNRPKVSFGCEGNEELFERADIWDF